MKADKRFLIFTFIVIVIVIIPSLVLWDSLTSCGNNESLTIVPWKVDWRSASFENLDVNSYIQTFLSAFIGLALTIYFIEHLLRRSRDKEIEYKRQLGLNNIALVLKAPLFQYRKAALAISYKSGCIPEDNKMVIPNLNILRDVFSPHYLTDNPLFESKIDFYSRTLDDLYNIIMTIVLNADLSSNPELLRLFSEYLCKMYAWNPCRKILKYKTVRAGDKLLSELLAETDLSSFEPVSQPSHVFHSIYVLHEVIGYHEDFLRRLFVIAPEFRIDALSD